MAHIKNTNKFIIALIYKDTSTKRSKSQNIHIL